MVEFTDQDGEQEGRTRSAGRRRGRPSARGEAVSASVQSLDRALSLLEAISGHEHGVSLTELAEVTALPPSTAHRLLKSLESRGYLRQDAERGLWFVGVQAFVVGSAFVRGRDIVAIARPHMRDLMEDTRESVNLAILDGREAIYLSQVECRQMIRAHALPGGRALLHCSGVGKALLAALPEERARTLLGQIEMLPLTPRTIVSREVFLAGLQAVRQQGYAIDDEEQSLGMRCVAAAIYDENADPVAAVSISGPSARLGPDQLGDVGNRVRQAAEAITAAAGGRVPARRALSAAE